jgi:tripartite-type tricarboxylate transporter receptor subunit TctC
MKRNCVWLISVLCVFCLTGFVQTTLAQTYPNQTIQIVVPMAPGDTVDLADRAIVTEMTKTLKTPVVVTNKPGGGSTVGADFVAKRKKDGYTNT